MKNQPTMVPANTFTALIRDFASHGAAAFSCKTAFVVT